MRRHHRHALLALLATVAAPLAQADCAFELEVGDGISYPVSEMEAEKSCDTVSVTIVHTGNLPKVAMGHNWVLTRPEDFQAVAPLGMSAGVAGDYVPADEPRILANTALVGGGESDTVEFSVSDMETGEYTFYCSFPGHWSNMKGTFRLL